MSKRASRRGFLRQTTAVVAAPWVITSTALGNQDRVPASERVTLGYLGTGPRGRLNIREQLSCPDAQVVAVCDVWKNVRETAKNMVDAHYKNTDCQAYNDFRDVLARADIDAVGIASPDHWHVPMTVAAAKAGKDVCVEKPLGISVEQDQICRDVIKRYGRVLQYGTEARAADACRLGAELVRNGRIGKVREIRVKSPDSIRGGSREAKPVPAELDYEMWLGPAPYRPYSGCPDQGPNWFHVRDYALGFIAGWAAHPLDLLQWAFDTHLQGNMEISGTGVLPTDGCNDALMNWDLQYQFASGVRMKFFAAGVPQDEDPLLAGLGNYAQLIGDDGWIAMYYRGMICKPESLAAEPLGPDDLRLPVSKGQELNFIECVKSRATPVSHIDDAVRTDTISHLGDIAVRVGRKITWDPVSETIIDDEAASRMLSSTMRDPWRL